jgi:hypothetical protein
MATSSILTMITGKDGQIKCFCGCNIYWIHFLIYSIFNFMGLNIELKTDLNCNSTHNEQQTIILQRHFGKDSSKSIHQKGIASCGWTDRDEKDKR